MHGDEDGLHGKNSRLKEEMVERGLIELGFWRDKIAKEWIMPLCLYFSN